MSRWKNLSKEEQEKWNKCADIINRYPMLRNIVKERKCPMCNYRFEEQFSDEDIVSSKFLGEVIFHWQSTHGIPREIAEELILKKQ